MSFKSYLLNEEKSYLGHRVGDVLTAAQELEQDMENLGSRHLNRLADNVVNQIRKILHGHWGTKSEKHLQKLQRIAVAIKKTIEDKGDLKQMLPTAVQELQTISGQLGVKVNNLEAPPEQMGGEDVSQSDFELTGDGPAGPPAGGDMGGGGQAPPADPNAGAMAPAMAGGQPPVMRAM